LMEINPGSSTAILWIVLGTSWLPNKT